MGEMTPRPPYMEEKEEVTRLKTLRLWALRTEAQFRVWIELKSRFRRIPPSTVVVPVQKGWQWQCRTEVMNQLTLSFRGQVYVFDAVTAEKVQAVLLLLGGSEYTPDTPGVDVAYQNPRGLTVYSGRCNDPKRVESLNRFHQKRKERCFEKKIRYNVRQEVAMKMQRNKGQFAPRISEDCCL